MSRSLGAVDAVHSLLPEEAALLFGLLTQFGDIWFLFAVAIACYWFRPPDRERVAVVLGAGIVTVAAVEALKGLFRVPRPDAALATTDAYPIVLRGLFEATATGGGHGFPSGHATLSTVMLLGLAAAVRIGSARRRTGLAIGLIGLVSLTRVALGVHFLVDVVAGALVGLAVLAGIAFAVQIAPTSAPTTAFGLAVGGGLAGVVLTVGTLDPGAVTFASLAHDPFLAFAVALGAFAGWQGYLVRHAGSDRARTGDGGAHRVGTRTAAPELPSPGRTLLVIAPLLVLFAIGIAGMLVDDATAAQAGVAGIGVAIVVALPALVPQFDPALAGYVPGWIRRDPSAIDE